MDHTISILVENEFGVLARVVGLFSGRGFNIESLTVAKTLDSSLSRITLVTSGDDQIVEQITKQLNKLICVIKVVDFKETTYVEREMALVKVSVDERIRSEVLTIANIFRTKVIDVDSRSYVIEITGDEDKISAFINLLKPLGIKEIVRTGKVAIQRGTQVLTDSSRGEVVELKGKAKKEKVS
jgi:acetolactate synthase-1/3 small subunit